MSAQYYPEHAPVPIGLVTEEFLLRPLTADDVHLDYDALMASHEMLRRWSGTGWPAEDFTLAENLLDLQRHEQEHRASVAFTYTLMNPAGDLCLGCCYVEPLDRLLERAESLPYIGSATVGDFTAVVRFWVRQSFLADDLDERLLNTLISWLGSDWAFAHFYFRTNELDRRQVALFERAGFERRYALELPDVRGRYLLYEGMKPSGQ